MGALTCQLWPDGRHLYHHHHHHHHYPPSSSLSLYSPTPRRSVLWINGQVQALPEGVVDWRDLEQEINFAVAGEHQFLQVGGRLPEVLTKL